MRNGFAWSDRGNRRRRQGQGLSHQSVSWPVWLFVLLAWCTLAGAAPTRAAAPGGRAGALEGELLVFPYLGETTTTSTVIAWAMTGDHAGVVRYGIGSTDQMAVAERSLHDGMYWYAAHIDGLQPQTHYQYALYIDGQRLVLSSDLSFTTAPDATANQVHFAVLADSRPGDTFELPSQGALDVAEQLGRRSFDLVLHVGDMVYAGGVCSGENSGWKQYMRQYFDLYRASMSHMPFYTCIGNHELAGDGCGYEIYAQFSYLPENALAGAEEAFYSFDWGNAHFITLDTNTANLNADQYAWLVSDLQHSTRFWTFVMVHYPPYSSGQHGSYEVLQEYLAPIFETYGADVVFAGHDHHYERTCPIREGACTTLDSGGVVYYVTGGAGSSLYDVSGDWFTASMGSIFEFLDVVVDGCRLRVDAIRDDGALFDSYTIDRCEAPSPTPTITATPSSTPTPSFRLALPLLYK